MTGPGDGLTGARAADIPVEAVVAVCRRHGLGSPDRVTRVAGSVGNQDFLLERGLTGVVLKAGNAQLLTAEAWACERVRGAGVRAPEVVVVEPDPSQLGLPYLVMRELPGGASDDPQACRDAGRDLRRVHEVTLPGYGRLLVEDGSAAGEHRSWCAFVDSVLESVPRLVAAAVVPSSIAAPVMALVAELDPYVRPGVLLHGDLKTQHIFAVRSRYVGIIDWGDASCGDPLYDLARYSMTGGAAYAAFLEGYGSTLTPQVGRTLAAYRVLWNLAALAYELDAGGDWFATYRDRIADDVRTWVT